MSNYLLYEFFGAFFDASFLIGLFVPAEPFLLSAGMDIRQGLWVATLMVLLGGFLGDQGSYWLGSWKGGKLFRAIYAKFPSIRKHAIRSRALFGKKQNQVIVMSRVLGPVNAFVPFFCGTRKVSWLKFTLLSTLGLFIAVGQFLIWGALLATLISQYSWIGELSTMILEHLPLLILTVCTLFVLWRKRSVKLTVAIGTVGLIAINMTHFFYFNTPKMPLLHQETIDDYSRLPLNVYPGKSKGYPAQAINIVYKGENPTHLMEVLGWLPNKTFSRNQINIPSYVTMLDKSTPPVSDLFWKGEPQWQAWQQPGTLTQRSHIRWWFSGLSPTDGEKVWVGALSYDEHLQLTRYRGFFTVLHDTSPDIDQERNRLREQVEKLFGWQSRLTGQPKHKKLPKNREYYTDGRLLIIQSS